MATVTLYVLGSPAVAILCGLERDGFTVKIDESDNGIVIIPRSRLTTERMAEIRRHKDALKLLLMHCSDAGVTARVVEFRRQLAATAAPGLPALVFMVNVSYVKGTCFSCADRLPELRFGRCWRCSLACRLACRLPIPAVLAEALDAAKVCA